MCDYRNYQSSYFTAGIYFIDGSLKDKECPQGLSVHQSLNTSFSSLQQVELDVLIHFLQLINKPLNILSDYAYIVGLFPTVDSHLCPLYPPWFHCRRK